MTEMGFRPRFVILKPYGQYCDAVSPGTQSQEMPGEPRILSVHPFRGAGQQATPGTGGGP